MNLSIISTNMYINHLVCREPLTAVGVSQGCGWLYCFECKAACDTVNWNQKSGAQLVTVQQLEDGV